MVSIYDVFYVIAKNGTIAVKDIVVELGKTGKDYQNIFNNVLLLEKKHLVKRDKKICIANSFDAEELFNMISFSLRNSINYNILFKDKMLFFLEKASKKEFFTIDDIKIHSATFRFYVDALSKYGLLIVISKSPLKCKLLKSQYIMRLLNYFKKNANFYIQRDRSHIPDIKRELKKYRRNLVINEVLLNGIEKSREVGFIYSSLNLEGNPLTLPETEKLLIENVVPQKQKIEAIEETINYKRAIDHMFTNSKHKLPLNKEMILQYHAIAMNGKSFAGKFRKENVFIKLNPEFITSDWKDIENRFSKLMNAYLGFESSKQDVSKVIEFCAFFHNEFQRIHPFIDGNSRISRLLMLHILRMHDLPVLELPLGYFDSYLDLTKKSKKRDDLRFAFLVEEIVLTNLKNLNNTINVYEK